MCHSSNILIDSAFNRAQENNYEKDSFSAVNIPTHTKRSKTYEGQKNNVGIYFWRPNELFSHPLLSLLVTG